MKGMTPRIVNCLKGYNKETFMKDLMAGIIVGIVALPLAIAFGIASGVTPEKGIITAIVAGFIISLLGGTKVQIGGPTGAFIVIIYGIVNNPEYGLQGLLIATILAGIILIALGAFRLGVVIKFIPYPIIIGFTAGIALTIFTTQISDILGLTQTAISTTGEVIRIPPWRLHRQVDLLRTESPHFQSLELHCRDWFLARYHPVSQGLEESAGLGEDSRLALGHSAWNHCRSHYEAVWN